jgi:hypothetical protein
LSAPPGKISICHCRMSVVAIANLPSQTRLQNYGQEKLNNVVSHQHPDHD